MKLWLLAIALLGFGAFCWIKVHSVTKNDGSVWKILLLCSLASLACFGGVMVITFALGQ